MTLSSFTDEIAYLLLDNKLTEEYINPVYITYFLTVLSAVTLVTFGSYSTVQKPKNALDPTEYHPLFDQSDKDIKEVPSDASIDEKTASYMPIIAGCSLVGLYYGTKNFNPEVISYYLNKYIIFASNSAASFTLSYFLTSLTRRFSYQFGISSLKFNPRYGLTFSKDSKIHSSGIEENLFLPEITEEEKIIKEEKLLQSRSDIVKKDQLFNLYFTAFDLVSLVAGLGFSGAFAYFDGSKNWVLNNVLGLCLTTYGISNIRIPKFKAGFILLVLFFIYDIYFVFGSDIMMKVATTIEIPCKILIPSKASRETGELSLSLLGLGDIVLPGLFISLCLRFDLYKFHEKNPDTEFHHLQSFPKPYFTTVIIGYLIGLGMTLAALHFTKHGQPALLYISPCLLISLSVTAFFKDDFKSIFSYDEKSKVKTREIKINCSKETIFLATGEIASDDEEDEDDGDFILTNDEDEEDDEEEYDLVLSDEE